MLFRQGPSTNRALGKSRDLLFYTNKSRKPIVRRVKRGMIFFYSSIEKTIKNCFFVLKNKKNMKNEFHFFFEQHKGQNGVLFKASYFGLVQEKTYHNGLLPIAIARVD